MQTAILTNYLTGVADPVGSAVTALTADLPDVCAEIEQVRKAILAGKSLGRVANSPGFLCLINLWYF